MINKLLFKSLTLVGMERNYIVKFKKGLNFISGPTSTGKSTIPEMISYALGSKKHKDYIEVRESCSNVELEFLIGNNAYKITRPLFDFKRPVKLYRWDHESQEYNDHFELLNVESSGEENTLSAFLLNELGFFNVKVANQFLSFRDLFKYCYVKQTEVDTENILLEKVYGPSIKRKPTFELIFNMYDTLLSELKNNSKQKIEEINDLEKKKGGIHDFLKSLELLDFDLYFEQKKVLETNLIEKKEILYRLKSRAKMDPDLSRNIEQEIFELKEQLEHIHKDIYEQKEYENKLILLRNQYSSEKEKIEFLIEGAASFSRYKFVVCPSCLNDLEPKESSCCEICGSDYKGLTAEEISVYRSELRKLTVKFNKLTAFIDEQSQRTVNFTLLKENKLKELIRLQEKLDHLRNDYVSPYVEQLEMMNYEIGEITNKLNELDKHLIIMRQFNRVTENLLAEKEILRRIKDRIKEIETDINEKESVINEISIIFEWILFNFSFPKLSDAYIGIKDYLPYARGRKYDDLGSLGSVTMINMAYFLAILILGVKGKNNHPGILIIDTPRKNLGSDPKDEEDFKDERIYNSIIKFFMKLDEENKDEFQLIVINNGYPDFLYEEQIIIKFDGDGTKGMPYGLIDDRGL